MSSNSRKLEFGTTFYGREVERRQLKDAYLRLLDRQPVAVLVGGRGGAGKTRLVRQVISELQEEVKEGSSIPFYYCSGKADELLYTDPYSSIVAALGSLAKELVGDESLKQRILKAVGSEGRFLTQAVPELEAVIGKQPELEDSSNATTTRNRSTYLFQALLAAIGRPEKRLIMHLDDLQWTDASTISLIRNLLMSPDMAHFLFIGSYRDDEIDSNHALTRTLDSLRKNGKPYFTLTLGNLSRSQAQQLVEDTLQQKDIEALVDAVYQKTQGNVYSLKAALQLMERRNALRYVAGRWEWDDMDTEVSDNAPSMVLNKLFGLDDDLQLVLMTAAYLRSAFPLTALVEVLQGAFKEQEDWPTVPEVLEKAVSEGLLENSLGSNIYRFSHDHVRQASLVLAKNEGREFVLAIRVGHYLLTTEDAEDWMFFLGVDHWNAVPLGLLNANGCDTFHLASLNLEAGTKASEVGAFAPASSYFRKGIDLLQEQPERWRFYYSLCLDLYSSAAEIEFCSGSFETGESYTHEVVAHAFQPMDTARVYWSLAEALGRKERHMDAMDIYLKQLRLFKEVPKGANLFGVARKLQRTKAMLKKISLADLKDKLDLMSPERIAVVETLNHLSVRSLWCGQKYLALWATLRACEISVHEGICKPGLACLSNLSAILCSFDPRRLDVVLGRKLSTATEHLASRLGAKSLEAQMQFNSGCYVDCWDIPFAASIDRLQVGYFTGLRTGEYEFAFLDRTAVNLYQFICGGPLDMVLEEYNEICERIDQHDLKSAHAVLANVKGLVEDLTGRTEDPFQWARTSDTSARNGTEASSAIALPLRHLRRVQVAYYLQRYDLAEKALALFVAAWPDDLTYPTLVLGFFFQVLVHTACYRESKQRRHKSRARRCFRSAYKKLSDRRLNNSHKFKILEADMESTFHDEYSARVKDLFDEAIADALARSFIQDAALANELAGEYFLRVRGDDDQFWAKRYFTNAHALYVAWEAKAKVQHLMKRRHDYIDLEISKEVRFTPSRVRFLSDSHDSTGLSDK